MPCEKFRERNTNDGNNERSWLMTVRGHYTHDNVRQEYTRFKEIAAVLDHKKDKGYKGPLPVQGSYHSMLLRYAIIIADEIGKASQSRSKTSKAMCALQAEKRMGLTGTPLENDYDEFQTLMKWKPKKTKAKPLKGVRNAILSTSLRACFFPLAIDDTFNRGRLVEFSRHSVRTTKLTLPTAEAAHQKETRPIWGKQKGDKDRERWSERLRVRALPEVLKARVKVVGPGVAAGGWTPGRSPSSVSIQSTGQDAQLRYRHLGIVFFAAFDQVATHNAVVNYEGESYVDMSHNFRRTEEARGRQSLSEDDEGANLAKDSESKDEYGGAKDFEGLGLDLEATMGLAHKNIFLDMSHKQARQRLFDKPKDYWSSARINTLMPQPVPIHEPATEGKIIVLDEFLQSLDVETEKDWHSTRVNKLIEQILSLHESKSEGKIIITDEFLQTLGVVSNALRATGIEFFEFNGHMSLKERDAVRERFNDPKDKVRVMLATIKCFGLGLTLNPAIDAQAASRINRIGQNRQVTIWTFYAHNSIERYVEKEWERKKKKAVLTLDQKGAIARVNRTGQDREVTVWTYKSPNSIEAYVTKAQKKKKKIKAKLESHQEGVSKHLKNQMANLTTEAFRHTLTKLRVEGAASKKKAAKTSLMMRQRQKKNEAKKLKDLRIEHTAAMTLKDKERDDIVSRHGWRQLSDTSPR
ncbi:uncharacterized protein J4E87_007719 [Alternaria ethzedia]|uniref:uncharacterized protein n=1 Tax=Alternaria ethzedia TaxID=181014 RepID=UPI0020C1D842|nr:uncharacterized protein J4E87_007719 [Alternaria ethzedia]KAI4619132.1 hypothetical protein J4E87_007719 [Alternaria ethzedia]